MKYYYGAKDKETIDRICNEVNSLFGSNPNALALMKETLTVETNYGTYKDPTPNGAGAGISQIDKIPFYDFQNRILMFYPDIVKKIDLYFRENKIMCNFKDLKWGLLLFNDERSLRIGIVMMRCAYWLIPSSVPKDLKGRAKYWKDHYNTSLGKGTIEKYIQKNTHRR